MLRSSTIIDFLQGKGMDVVDKPTTKLTPEQYDLLCVQFADDQGLKELSKQSVAPKEKKETVSLRDNDVKEEVVEKVVEETPAPVEPVVEKEEVVETVETKVEPEPVVEEKPAIVEAKAPVIEKVDDSKAGDNSKGPNILGKIDLDKINTKTRPDKKKNSKGKERN